MDTKQAQTIDRRLARLEGQVRGIRRMLAEDAYCIDVLTQVTAAKSALEQVAAAIAAQHIKHCVAGHSSGEGHAKAKAMSQEELLDELDEVMGRLVR